MKDISTYIPISKAKSDLLEIIRRLENVEDAVAVTKNGVPAAVILSMEKYQGLLETLDILSDEKAMKSLRTSLRQARKRKWVKYDEVFGRWRRAGLVSLRKRPGQLPDSRPKSNSLFELPLTSFLLILNPAPN
jgi:antitoxin YefM